MAEEVEERTLESTPTWAVSTVCFTLIFVSIIIEHLLILLAKVCNNIKLINTPLIFSVYSNACMHFNVLFFNFH